MAKVELGTVNKIYPSRRGPVHAVQDLDMTIDDGEFVALLGPSGCGKTSTLRMIVGLEQITSGNIAFDGTRINELTPEQRNVAMAFETYALYPNFTIAENLGFPLEVRGLGKAERERQVRHISGMLQLDQLLDHKPGQLSGGQQQRVSLGRALIRDPAVFILDEVMSHLDAHLKFQMLFELKRIHQRLGRTMVYVTHDQMEALALADRVAVMSNARLQQFGTRNDLYHRPVNRFVADFIGEPPTNFIQVRVISVEGAPRLESADGASVFTPSGTNGASLTGLGLQDLTLGIRPQSLTIEPREGHRALNGQVVLNEYLGEVSILTVSAGASELRALVPPSVTLGAGAAVTLYYDPEDVMLFHPDTEELIT